MSLKNGVKNGENKLLIISSAEHLRTQASPVSRFAAFLGSIMTVKNLSIMECYGGQRKQFEDVTLGSGKLIGHFKSQQSMIELLSVHPLVQVDV